MNPGAGNLSDLNVAASATFNTVEANVRVNKITGSGTIATGLSGAGYQNLTIGADNGSSSFGGVITDSLAPGNLVKVGTGTITLTGASTYTGTTTVEAGTLSLAQAFLNNNAAVVIGFDGTLDLGFLGTDVIGSLNIEGSELPPGVYNSDHPYYGSHFTGTGSLEIPGANGTWTSLVNGDWSVATNWSGSSVASGIDSIATFSAATGVTVNLDSNRPIGGLVFGTTGYTVAGSSTLTLNTTSDISTISVGPGLAATISAKLASVDALTKAGTGTLTLSAQNNFSNAINVSQGTLELATDWTFGNVGTGTAIVPGLVTVESGATLRAVNSLANQLNGLTLNGGTVEAVGVGNADWGNFHLTGNVTATGTSNLNADIALRAANVDFFVDSGATLNVGGVMHNGAFFGIYSGTPSNVSKSGDGTMVLSAANTYTGSTTVDAGTLVLADNAQLKFVVTDAPAANMVTGTGTATFNGDFNIDTSGVAGTTGGIWLLVDRTNLTGESFDPVTFSVIGFTDANDDGVWLMTDAKGNWSFDEATGELTLDVGNDYDDWVTANGVTGGENDDDDSDGLTNHEEYAFGLDPTGGSSVNAIVHPARQVHRQVPLHPPCHPGSHRPCLHDLDINRSRYLDRRHWSNLIPIRHRHGRRSRNRRSHRHRHPSAHSTQTLHPGPRPMNHHLKSLSIESYHTTRMKNKTTSLAALAAITIAGSASAANIIWSTPQAIAASTDVSTQGTLFTAKSTGYNYTVNGVFFDASAANILGTQLYYGDRWLQRWPDLHWQQ